MRRRTVIMTTLAASAGAYAWYKYKHRGEGEATSAETTTPKQPEKCPEQIAKEEAQRLFAGMKAEDGGADGKTYTEAVRRIVTEYAPEGIAASRGDVLYGTLVKKTYYSTTRERETNVNVLLPPGYREDRKYPVLYALHGFWGNEDSLPGMSKAQNMLGNLIAAGEAEPMIVVFPYIYTSKSQPMCTHMDQANALNYDNFINDLRTDLMPYIESTFAVKTGRENTAITGFSMGGRESLYIAVRHPECFGYVGAACPAPGLTPGEDRVMGVHPGQLGENELAFGEGETPYVLLLTAGEQDTVVNEHPANYHRILTENGVAHIRHSVTEGGHDGVSVTAHFYNLLRAIFRV